MASLRTRLAISFFVILLLLYSWRTGVSISDVSPPLDLGKSPETLAPSTSSEALSTTALSTTALSTLVESTTISSTSSSTASSVESPTATPTTEAEPKVDDTEKPAEVKEEDKPNPPPEAKVIPDHPTRKPDRPSPLSIVDNFPLAASAHSAAELPPLPPWNLPPNPHVEEKTPLFIGFTRNWLLLQQTVVSHITAGWPAEDIYVFENTGTMNSNERGLLSLQNPFFLNHTRLQMLGVNVLTTPTLLNFAQLQNFYIYTAIQKNFTSYFWGHMDIVAVPHEFKFVPGPDNSTEEKWYASFKSPYKLAVEVLRNATGSGPDPHAKDPEKPWAVRFFAYDKLALVNREAFEKIGGWDTTIPYYYTDCDMHERISMSGHDFPPDDVLIDDVRIGNFTDVAGTLDDLIVLYRKSNTVQANFTMDWDPEQARKAEEEKAVKDLDAGRGISDAKSETSALRHRFVRRMNTNQTDEKWKSDVPGSAGYYRLLEVLDQMEKHKNRNGGGGRNTWQRLQSGGQGDPYYRDSEGFDIAIGMLTQTGRDVFAEKWGHRECDIIKYNRKAGDEWRLEHDWE